MTITEEQAHQEVAKLVAKYQSLTATAIKKEDYNPVGLTPGLDMSGKILKGLLCSILKFII
jgi:hypothetical protein